MHDALNFPTILHVDDDENDRFLVSLAHERAKVATKVIGVEDGEEAIAYLEGQGMSRISSAPLAGGRTSIW